MQVWPSRHMRGSQKSPHRDLLRLWITVWRCALAIVGLEGKRWIVDYKYKTANMRRLLKKIRGVRLEPAYTHMIKFRSRARTVQLYFASVCAMAMVNVICRICR